MEGEELPPVVAVFKADIAEFMAKVEEVKLALDSIGNQRGGFARVEGEAAAARREIDSGIRRSVDNTARSMDDLGRRSERAATAATMSWDRWMAKFSTMFPDIRDRYTRAFDDFKATNEEAARKMEGDFRRAFQTIVENDAKGAFAQIDAYAARSAENVTTTWGARTREALLFAQEIEGEQSRLAEDARRNALDQARIEGAQVNRRLDMWRGMFDQIAADERRAAAAAERYAFDQAQTEGVQINRRVDMWRGMFDRIEQGERDFRRRMEGLEALAPGTTATYERAVAAFRERMGSAADGMQRDFDRAFFNIADRDARRAFDLIITGAGRAGDDAGRRFAGGFRGGNSMFAGLGPGGRRPNWGALIGGLLPMLAPSAAGLATPVVSGLGTLMPALAGTAVTAVFAKDAFGEVTKAAAALETQTNKYNTAADQTARFLQSDSSAMADFKSLLTQVTGPQADVLKLLNQQDVTWGSLSTTQQNAVIQIRDTKDLYKALSKSQQDQVNALLAEKAAYDKLDPAQGQALTNYQQMHTVYDKLRTAAMPSMFGTIATAEQAAADGMKPLLPVIQQSALGWGDLFTKLDGWFKSPDYQKFVDMWSGTARGTIDAIGTAVGNVALGFIHMWEALSPMIGPSEEWLKNWSAGFANWANTPKGAAALTHFMEDLQKNGPATWGALSNIAHSLGNIIAALAWNPIAMQALQDIAGLVRWASGSTIGKAIINIGAWALAINRLAQSFGLLALAQKALGTSNVASAAGAAGAGGLNLLTAGEARTMGVAGAGATLGETSAVGGAAAGGGIASRIFAGGVAGASAPELAAVLGAPLVMAGVVYYADKVHQASDRAKGIITQASGVVTAGWTDNGIRVSQAFHDLANTYKTEGKTNVATLSKNSEDYRVAMGSYNSVAKKGNQDVVDVLYLGRTQFGQTAGLFVKDFGYNVANMGAGLKKQGKTLDQAMLSSLEDSFANVGSKAKEFWRGFKDTMVQGLDDFFAKQRATTKTDYTTLGQAAQQYEDDHTHGRMRNMKKDSEALTRAVQQYEDDSNKGLISNSSKNMKQLSADLAKYMNDLGSNNTAAWAGDIRRLGDDTKTNFGKMTDNVDAYQSHKFDMEIAQAQIDISQANSKIASGILGGLPGHAAGGFISGPGTGTSDSLLARLSNGEFVVNAQATSEHRPLLEAINSRFATGGYVDPAGPRAIADQRMYVEDVHLRAAAQAARDALSALTSLGHGVGPGGQQAIAYAASRLGAHGWGQDQLAPLVKLWNQESGWNSYAVNPSSGAYGIPQSLGHGHPYNLGDYKAQVDWGENYIASAYGSPSRAWGHEQAYNWYDKGGWLQPGVSAALNMTGQPEAVLTSSQWRAVESLAAGGGGDVVVPITIELDGQKLWQGTRRVNLQQQRRNGKSTFNYGTQRVL